VSDAVEHHVAVGRTNCVGDMGACDGRWCAANDARRKRI